MKKNVMKRVYVFFLILSSFQLLAGSVEFSLLGSGSSLQIPVGFLNEEGEFTRIRVQRMTRSQVYRYRGSERLRLVTPVKAIDGSTDYRTIWQYPVPETPTRLLLLVSGGKEAPMFYVMDDSLKNFGFGEYKYINLTQRELVVLHDEEKFTLKPEEIRIISPQTADKGRYPIRIASRENEEFILAFTNSNRHYDRARYLCFITEYTPPKRGVRLGSITETPTEAIEFGDPIQ
jgi:hypothetical protein